MTMIPIPGYNEEGNSIYNYRVDKYKVSIVIDELNDDLLLLPSNDIVEFSYCQCNDFKYRKRPCKHMKQVVDYLKSCEINVRLPDEPES
jgi:hypothetical protein